jgi:hypothetical protein
VPGVNQPADERLLLSGLLRMGVDVRIQVQTHAVHAIKQDACGPRIVIDRRSGLVRMSAATDKRRAGER